MKSVNVAVFAALSLGFAQANDSGGGIDPEHQKEHARLEKAIAEIECAREQLAKERAETEAFAKQILEEIEKAKMAQPPVNQDDTKEMEARERRMAGLEKELQNRQSRISQMEIEMRKLGETRAKEGESHKALEKKYAELTEELNGMRNIEKSLIEDQKKAALEMDALKVKLKEMAAAEDSSAKGAAAMQALTRDHEALKKSMAESGARLLEIKKQHEAKIASLSEVVENTKNSETKCRETMDALNRQLQKEKEIRNVEIGKLTESKMQSVKELESALNEMVVMKAEQSKMEGIRSNWDAEKADLVASLKEKEEKLTTYTDRILKVEEQSAKARGELVKEKVARQKLERQIELMQLPAVDPIYFGLSDAESKSEQERVLKEVNALLVRFPELKIHVVGHTCNQGTDEANLVLSALRAQTLGDYLIANGIAKEKVSFEGKGESLPVNDNSTEELRKKNRRVEVWLSN